ncbi:hypothetical protein SEVIR_3G226500v4 [Setaria viridis]|uniref:AAA+ ATPase domain-containing protein n=1 Tax=Setaria viridis TaxID=4556 RepID=A0A4V6D9T0_SETVI|nr:disease resistance protein RGA5-like [Setaria viridis]TKW26976.1 hypothetical protein SEVIR_3G226500v2 [Setaria viridis]
MEGAAASAATGALQPVVEKLTALLGDEHERFKPTRGEIELLAQELDAIKAFLIEKSEVEDPGEEDRLWMKDVRELSYDIEDSLDEFMLHAGDKSAKPDGFMEKIRSLLENTKSCHRIAKEIEDLKKKAIDAAERNQRYSAGDQPVASAYIASVDPRALAMFEDVTKLIGIDGPNGELIRLLEKDETGDGSAQQQTRVISIVGSGGTGKTTLAHQVYQKLEGRYNHRAFLSVSRNPDIKGILRTILYEVVRQKDFEAVIKGDYVSRVDGEDQLVTKIREYLTGKRYFILLDDIWDVQTWNSIKDIFPMTSCGSKIITTTCTNDVAQECCRSSTNGHIYNITPLSMADSTQLFYRRLFNPEEKCPSHLEEISGQILEKCAGLPLAITAISGLLSSKKKTKEKWDRVKKLIGRGLERNSSDEVMSKILSLSYFDLPLHLKACLLYLSIFPKYYTIGKQNLIRRWIGEGFIHEQNGISAAYDLGERCFNDLINRSLIQPAGRDKFFEVNSCRVHDTVFDFIVSKAIEENFVTLIGVPGVNPIAGNKVRRLSIQNDGEIPSELVLSSVRSLNVFGGNMEIPSLLEFRLLHVLAFEDCKQLKDDHLADVGNLLHLRHLRLNHANAVTKLPEATAELKHLGTLEVHGHDTLMEIPAAICQVGRLECLVTLVVTDDYAVLPDKIVDMKALRVLEGVSVYRQSIDFIRRLGELTDLRKLGMIFVNSYADEEWEEKYEEIVSSIYKLTKANLDSLHIYTLNEPPELLDNLSKEHPDPLGLRELVIEGDAVSGLAAWWGLLVNLQKLLFCADESVSEEDVETLRSLPFLEYLCIHLWDAPEDPEVKAPLERAMKAHPNLPKLIWVDLD